MVAQQQLSEIFLGNAGPGSSNRNDYRIQESGVTGSSLKSQYHLAFSVFKPFCAYIYLLRQLFTWIIL
jgi:hypothetical protein